jgi:hypothetical protein
MRNSADRSCRSSRSLLVVLPHMTTGCGRPARSSVRRDRPDVRSGAGRSLCPGSRTPRGAAGRCGKVRPPRDAGPRSAGSHRPGQDLVQLSPAEYERRQALKNVHQDGITTSMYAAFGNKEQLVAALRRGSGQLPRQCSGRADRASCHRGDSARCGPHLDPSGKLRGMSDGSGRAAVESIRDATQVLRPKS